MNNDRIAVVVIMTIENPIEKSPSDAAPENRPSAARIRKFVPLTIIWSMMASDARLRSFLWEVLRESGRFTWQPAGQLIGSEVCDRLARRPLVITL